MADEQLLERMGLDGPAESDVYDPDRPYRAFGITRRAFGGEPMLDLVTKDGNHHALAYPHLYHVSYDPSTGLVLDFSDHVVTIRGRQLGDCYRRLLMHRVVFVAEADHAVARLLEDEEPVVAELFVAPRHSQPFETR